MTDAEKLTAHAISNAIEINNAATLVAVQAIYLASRMLSNFLADCETLEDFVEAVGKLEDLLPVETRTEVQQ